ncbi:MAG: zf-HC2 domain-containing protein [Myxococcota bacterium]|nr:zf-HC2 domain-containing protein [Myxococcota bacterium]
MSRAEHSCIDAHELSAYVDGDLSRARCDEIATQIASCDHCRQVESGLRQVKDNLARCLHDRPGRNLWPEIDRRISAQEKRFSPLRSVFTRWLPVPVAAAVAVAVGFLFLHQPAQEPPSSRRTLEVNQAYATAQRAEMAYRDAIISLEQVLEHEQATFDPQTLAVVQQSLAEIDRAIERCRKAMLKDPDDMAAHRAVLAAYREKMDLLFELVGSRFRPEGA